MGVRVEALAVPDVARCSVAWLARGLGEPCAEALPVLPYAQSSGHWAAPTPPAFPLSAP